MRIGRKTHTHLDLVWMMIELGGNPPFGNPSGRAPRKKRRASEEESLKHPTPTCYRKTVCTQEKKTRRANARAKKAGQIVRRCFAHKHVDLGSWCTALSPILTGGEELPLADSSVRCVATSNGNWTDAELLEQQVLQSCLRDPCCLGDGVRETLRCLVAA